MPLPLADRIALVTGASRGIGYAVALALARAGAHVIAVARTVGGLEELDDAVRALGGSATLALPGCPRHSTTSSQKPGTIKWRSTLPPTGTSSAPWTRCSSAPTPVAPFSSL